MGFKDRLRELVSEPLWYNHYTRFNSTVMLGAVALSSTVGTRSVGGIKDARERLYAAFAELLEEGSVSLGKPGTGLYEFDTEREPIESAVIHHSHRANGTSNSLLNAMELIRLHVPVWQHPSPEDAPRISGQPIYTGHFDATGKMTFYPYHWMIRQDGSYERLLEDSQIGWHCGNWAVNKRSIAICFDDNLDTKVPNQLMLDTAREILTQYSGIIPLSNDLVQGHREILASTQCPGDQFLEGASWKRALLQV